MADKPPDAFLSYTRFDDHHDGGAISRLKARCVRYLASLSRPPRISTTSGWATAGRTSSRTRSMMSASSSPILTPGYFRSPACRGELKKFLEAETRAGRDDLILPIYYIKTPVLEEKSLRDADELAAVTAARQMWDWRELRHYSTKPDDARCRRRRRLGRDQPTSQRRSLNLELRSSRSRRCPRSATSSSLGALSWWKCRRGSS
jgi:hypothetical protein